MATNKEIKAQAEARRRAYEAKLAQVEVKATRRKNDNRFALVVAAVAVVLALGATYGRVAFNAAQPSATPTATDAVSATPTPTVAPTNSALVPKPAVAENRMWSGTMKINGRQLKISLNGKAAPQAVANFITLANKGFYNNVTCHRLVTEGIYVLQCGDPKGDGSGGPGYSWGPIENAPAADLYKTGVLAMARVGQNGYSMGSQFFIVYKDSTIPSDTAGGYTVFGNITHGMSLIDQIAAAGTATGTSDGNPKVATTLGAISVK